MHETTDGRPASRKGPLIYRQSAWTRVLICLRVKVRSRSVS